MSAYPVLPARLRIVTFFRGISLAAAQYEQLVVGQLVFLSSLPAQYILVISSQYSDVCKSPCLWRRCIRWGRKAGVPRTQKAPEV